MTTRETQSSSSGARAAQSVPSNQGQSSFGEPVAIVGMACKFPGGEDLSAFWRLLEAGESAVSDGSTGGRFSELFPDGTVRKDASRFAAFVDGIDQFDSEFFRISPIEAQLLDPQQRMMLETSWQALEDAGLDPDGLKGTNTGVYAGISNTDYRTVVLGSTDATEPAASLYTVTGTSLNTAIGRVAFALGLEGPAIAVDTACSSSLVAIHQAVSGLQRGESDMALAGGVQALLSGRMIELRASAGMLAPDGRCKTFDASADGYVRGEGCGVLVLKRLGEAVADGDRIWGVIKGSAVNQDGASPGLTVPNGQSQERVIEEALAVAGVTPSDVDYLEAHGTGTPVGDPIEMHAAAAAYGKGRDADRPLLIGSVKTNIGHLEPAAGVAGIIKTVLSMNQGVIPKHLNYRDPSPRIEWEGLAVQVTSEPTQWPQDPDKPRLAGVSAFGWSGTNAHILIEGYGESSVETSTGEGLRQPTGSQHTVAASQSVLSSGISSSAEELEDRKTRFLPLSGKSDSALKELAGKYLAWLDSGAGEFQSDSAAYPALADMAWTAGVGRSHLDRRAGVVFRDVASLRDRLRSLVQDDDGVAAPRSSSKVAFVYTGQGGQWYGMGKTLYETEPVVRAVLDRCEEVILEERGTSLLDVMFGREGAGGDVYDTTWAQPAVYALECAITALWASVGVRPSVVIGHSLGEFGAAHTAGVFSLEEGLRFVAKRGAFLDAVPEKGAMAAVFAPRPQVAEAIDEHNATSDTLGLSIAVDNGIHQVVSGPTSDIEAISEKFESEEIQVRRLFTNQAFHCALVEPALDPLEKAYSEVEHSAPSLTLVSNVTGKPIQPGEKLDGSYWRRHAREPVAFSSGIDVLADMGVDLVIEIGPHAVLGPLVSLAWPAGETGDAPVVFTSVLRPPRDATSDEHEDAFVAAVAGAYEAGLSISFEGLFAGEERRKVSLPHYPFQHRRHWIEMSRRRRTSEGHPLLGIRHESPRGDVLFETEMFPSDPSWLNDHKVFGRVVMPGALYGAMAVTASSSNGSGAVAVSDVQLHSPMVFPESDSEDRPGHDAGRRVQILLEEPDRASAQHFEIYSRGESEDGWRLHAEGRVSSASGNGSVAPLDLNNLKAVLQQQDVPAIYRAKSEIGIDFGASFRTVRSLWAGTGEAVGEVVLPETVDGDGLDLHPLLLDGCFQVLSAARQLAEDESSETYLPFGWEQLWLKGPLPERLICRARMRETATATGNGLEASSTRTPEVLTGDLWFYTMEGTPLGGLKGFALKRATRAAMLSAEGTLQDLLYEVVWRERPLDASMRKADFLASPAAVAAQVKPFPTYLKEQGVEPEERAALLVDMERLSQAYALSALEKLGWKREAGTAVDPDDLQSSLEILSDHRRLLRRLLGLLSEAGVLTSGPDGRYAVAIGAGDSIPDESLNDPEELGAMLERKHPHGSNELGMLRRCGAALADVLQGQADPLALLFTDSGPSAANLYREAPASRAANRMLAESVALMVEDLPEGRPLRILEVGAGTGSATEEILKELPESQVEYTFTDISAGFFAEAEARFGSIDAPIEYSVLDIETDPKDQGFDSHGYDLVIAGNVLHATRDLGETLAHCRGLLAPSGQLVALEGLRQRSWQDLTFGLLDGWWRFTDIYRPEHALATPPVWSQALADAGFAEVDFLGADGPGSGGPLGSGVIIAQGPGEVSADRGAWVLAADTGGVAADLASELTKQNQTVLLASNDGSSDSQIKTAGILNATVDFECRESWRSLLEELPDDVPLRGVVHLAALDGHGAQATTDEMASDSRKVGASALALVQAMLDEDVVPSQGTWLISKGAQVLGNERSGELAGATLWGIGKVMAREAAQLQPRMIDLDPGQASLPAGLIDELLFPDSENHIAYRTGSRKAARLVRGGSEIARLSLPDESGWRLVRDDDGALDRLRTEPLPEQPLDPREVRIAVEAAGLNFHDVLISMGVLDVEVPLGGEMGGRVVEVGQEVTDLSVGDRVVALGFGTFGTEVATRSELVAPAPDGVPMNALATVPLCFTTAALSFELAELKAGDRVLIHAGTGGVGQAAIQIAHAAGAEVYATASAPKQAYLRSLGVSHVFDSRQTKFGQEILDATGGDGVNVVLNSLTGSDFIEASLSCLGAGGRFVEIGKRDIWTERQMSEARPDVSYFTFALDDLKRNDPARAGTALREVMERISEGELKPIFHSVWPFSEAGAAMELMRSAQHVGKIVLTMPPLSRGQLREDRTYLVTGGFGGIGCVVAGWLAERGAGAIVLNGRRAPDPEAQETIEDLRRQGATVQTEIADVTDPDALDEMLARIDETLPPLGGIVHSVGVLSDGALTNQTWERFEQVLWPKILGGWHLHQATKDQDLDMFVLFSSITGVLGNSGQANHAAANSFLDQLAAHRRSLGLPCQAIAWGAWSGLGEAEEQRERIERQLESSGTGWISQQQGTDAFDHLVAQDVNTGMVAAVDWKAFAEGIHGREPLLEDVLPAATIEPSAEPADSEAPSSDLLAGLRAAPSAEHERLLVSFIQQELQAVLRLHSVPSPTVGFFELGMDSLMAVEMRNRLNRAFAGEYVASNTLVFDYPNSEVLAHHIAEELDGLGGSEQIEEQPEQEEPSSPVPAAELDVSDNGIAIVGMACRFPGADDITEYWSFMESGTDAVSDAREQSPSWNGVAGDPDSAETHFRRGGFIKEIDKFDSRFFRISPIEARMMDPQQRLLLETSWHALEDAGIAPDQLRGSKAGVYAGIGSAEYRDLIVLGGQGYGFLGTAGSVTVGRVAYALGLEGPAVPLDMACASSLVAVHQAAVALQQGEVDLALVGGVNAALSPAAGSSMTAVGMLSKSGRCSSFDASADGFVRGEGCGMVVMKRLSDALEDGDRIWGVVRGSSVNQNGTSAGLTVPNGPAQERVIEEALSRAGIPPSQVDYLEAHATGSTMGDPIEVHAASSVYGRGRDEDRPMLVGTVKTNIGHLESAAGIAGLIKAVLAMKRGVIPRHLHFENPSPLIDWDRLPVQVTSDATDWPVYPDRPPRAGVSAFGISGTNAHVVVEGFQRPEDKHSTDTNTQLAQGPAQPVGVAHEEPVQRQTRILPLSGKSKGALRDLAGRYLSWLDEHADLLSSESASDTLSDMAWTAGVGRSHFAHRAGVAFRDVPSLQDRLKVLAETEDVTDGPDPQPAVKVAFVYSGHGSQWVGMGKTLYESEAVARAVMDRCDAVLQEERGESLLDVMFGRGGPEGALDDPSWAQTAVYTLEAALTALWASIGIRPNIVLGQDVGEIAAAHAAGAFELVDGLQIAAARGARMTALSGGPSLGGQELTLPGAAYSSSSVALVSSVTGQLVEPGSRLDGAYWDRQAREQTAIGRCIETLADQEIDVVIEIGPDQVAAQAVRSAWPDSLNGAESGHPPVLLSSLRRPSSGDARPADCHENFIEAVATMYETGASIAFVQMFEGELRHRISVPSYPFQRRRHWI